VFRVTLNAPESPDLLELRLLFDVGSG